MHSPRHHARRSLVALFLGAACAAPVTPAPSPAPTPVPSRPVPAPAPVVVPAPPRDSAIVSAPAPRKKRVVARRPTAPVVLPAPARRSSSARLHVRFAKVPPSRVPVPARSARNDTLRVTTLHGPVQVCAGGDVTLGTNLFPEWSAVARRKLRTRWQMADDPATLLAPLRPLVRHADVLLLNVESAIGAGDTPSKCGATSTNCFAFRSPPAAAAALRALSPGVVVGNIANNHARDAGNAGVDSTIDALTDAGVLVTGADTIATAVRTPAGDSIGVLGFYTSKETPDARDTAAVYRHVARAAGRFPVVIVTMHLGAEGRGAQRTMDEREMYLHIDRGNPIAFADAAVRGGAALVIGHGPHVLRGMEWREHGALVAYSLGNLLTYGPFVLKEPLDRGAVLCTTFDTSGRVRSASLMPTMQHAAGVLDRDPTGRALVLVDSLSRLDFPATGVRGEPDGRLRPRGDVRR